MILEIILQRRHAEHKNDGYHGNLFAEGIYDWHPIKQNDKYKIYIGHTAELFEKIAR